MRRSTLKLKLLQFLFWFFVVPTAIYLCLDSDAWFGTLGPDASKVRDEVKLLARTVARVSLLLWPIWAFTKEFVMPVVEDLLRRVAVPAWIDGSKKIGEEVGTALGGLPWREAISYFDKKVAELRLRDQRGQPLDDPDVEALQAQVSDLLDKNKAREAIDLLDKSKQDSPEIQTLRLSALTSSDDPEDWSRAEGLLRKSGDPRHYTQLAMRYWNHGYIGKSILLTSEALRRARSEVDQSGEPEDVDFLRSCKNTLAYYLADRGLQDDELRARDLIEEVVTDREQLREVDEYGYWNSIDTRGYVKITFGNEQEIQEGMQDCKEANSHGIDAKLLHTHLARAHKRLSELPS